MHNFSSSTKFIGVNLNLVYTNATSMQLHQYNYMAFVLVYLYNYIKNLCLIYDTFKKLLSIYTVNNYIYINIYIYTPIYIYIYKWVNNYVVVW